MKKAIVSAFVVFTSLPVLTHAATGTASTEFKVKITVNESCKFTAAQDVQFSPVDRSTNMTSTATGQLNITCTLSTPYKIALAGNGEMSSMTAGSQSKVPYTLYQDSANTTQWDVKNLLSSTGSGKDQLIPVYAKLAGNTNVEAGDYVDTVVATVTY